MKTTSWEIRKYVPDSDDDGEEEGLFDVGDEKHDAAEVHVERVPGSDTGKDGWHSTSHDIQILNEQGDQDIQNTIRRQQHSEISPRRPGELSQGASSTVQRTYAISQDQHTSNRTTNLWNLVHSENQTARHNLSSPHRNASIFSDLSSPLSSISNTPTCLSPRASQQQDEEKSRTLPSYIDLEGVSEIPTRQERRPVRQLRERKAIQLNPYAVEGQLYKQAWKSRGLVPLQVKTDSQVEVNGSVELSSSQLEYESQSSDDARSVSNSYIENVNAHLVTSLISVEDGISTQQSIAELPLQSFERKPAKRRKLAQTHAGRRQHQLETPTSGTLHVREDGWIEVPFAHGRVLSPTDGSYQNTINKGPLSRTTSDNVPLAMTPVSIHSSSSTSSPILPDPIDQHSKSTAINGGTIPLQLRTPATSSDIPSSRQNSVKQRQILVRSPPKPVHDNENNAIAHTESTSEEEEDHEQILRQIVKAQRRTKGVLPASWHRLEYQKLLNGKPQATQKQQILPGKRRFTNNSPLKDTRKGVAKRITGAQRRTYGNDAGSISHAIIDIESDSEADNTITMKAKQQQQQEIDGFFSTNESFISNDNDDDDDTDMEDNSIDLMIDRGSTAKSHKIYRRKTKQPKIGDYLPLDDANSYGISGRQPSKKVSTPGKRQKRITNILDVTNGLTREQTPKYLAYAARTFKQRKHEGRLLLRQKNRYPSNVKESRTYQQHLRLQKDNFPSPAENSHHALREPLHERSSNNSRAPFILDGGDVVANSHSEAAPQQTQSLAAKIRENTRPGAEARIGRSTAPVRKDKFIVRGYPTTSVTGLVHPLAPAHLETTDSNRRRRHAVQRDRRLVLDRFLQRSQSHIGSTPSVPPVSNPIAPATHKVRKRLPRQVPVATTIENDQSESWESNLGELSSKESEVATRLDSSRLRGLLPLGAEYSTTLSVDRLPDGSHFQIDTLLGSGTFSESLNISLERTNLDPFRTTISGKAVEWSGWNETVAQQIFDICDKAVSSATCPEQSELLTVTVTDNSVGRLRSIIHYLSRHLRFLDPIDCKDFVVRWTTSMNRYDDQFSTVSLDMVPMINDQVFATNVICHIAIIANQIRQIANHNIVDQQIKKSVSEASASILKRLTQMTLKSGYNDFRLFSQDPINLLGNASRNRISEKSEAMVVISHLHQISNTSAYTIWDAFEESGFLVPPKKLAIPALERVWKNMFSLLPLLELDCIGQAPKHVLPLSKPNNWKLVKQLIEPVFVAYHSTTQQSTIHQYCRALYARCYWLLDHWGWNDCESIMGFLFDFFARNKLHDLRMELGPASVNFLTNLTSTTNLDVRISDRCFHVLLKFIGKGLRSIRKQYTDKRVSNCIWRLTPNHDRSLPKDESLRQEDLNAVHNHLDLLVVLYWAAPPQYRIRVDLIQNLIDIENSHKEVCHLVIKTWLNLVSFQLSTQESADKLDTFICWYEEIIVKLTRLHQLARTEVESDARRAEALRGQHFTKDDQERIIRASQRNVQSILIDALSSLKAAILKTETAENLRKMLPNSLRLVLELWEASRSNTSRIVIQVLDVVQAWTLRARQLRNAEDSQGYGDWSGFHELMPDIAEPTSLTVPNDLQQALQDFTSSVFGSEAAIEDNLLQSCINCWLDVAELEVAAGYLMWDDLIDPYVPKSWMALRDTAQTRKFTPLFLALLIKKDPKVYESKKLMITQCWTECLVERESVIKHQPDLTSALLERDITEPLFQNLPFAKEEDTFQISLADFLEQRIALIACVLSNMRESLSFSMYHQLQDCQGKRRDYSDLLRHLMNTMKNNFQSLGQGSDLQGTYVTFTQKIVQLLQEHTADICKVDSFFLDAVNFPLPADDPEYLVSKLKCLALQLHHNRGSQQLSAFIQSVCERAVIEGNQSHFASLIFLATEGVFEASQGEHLTLRFFIFCEILPEYIDFISSTPCGWIVAETLLLSLPMVLQSLVQNIDKSDAVSLNAAQSIISEVLGSISGSLVKILGSQSDLNMRTATIATRYLAIVEWALKVGDYVVGNSANTFDCYMDWMAFFAKVALYILGKLEGRESDRNCPSAPADTARPDSLRPGCLEAARKFVRESLHDSLNPTSRKCKWRIDGDSLLVHRNARWDVVNFDLRLTDQRQQELLISARSLLDKLSTIHHSVG
ncbi:MAG: hypothetical protein GOMPHAMPRED_005482 [Gomphillus americanus]|uniref:Uncharacterized protein n=1 Tax=Gomphillus americanus TaxID=1940652 RepID=A0A8H3FPD5_9LECA|nr:MAG: hypothetical protein GOMPHAMPRED_005482 [Gomphillus americanus]